jgi:hypothetical protein
MRSDILHQDSPEICQSCVKWRPIFSTGGAFSIIVCIAVILSAVPKLEFEIQ